MHSCSVGGVYPYNIVGCRLRKIWVDERLSLERVEGPENHQAAQVMGNSVDAWNKHYDLACNLRDSQAGVDSTAVWRRNMLAKSLLSMETGVEVLSAVMM